jgi:hypothetical protein
MIFCQTVSSISEARWKKFVAAKRDFAVILPAPHSRPIDWNLLSVDHAVACFRSPPIRIPVRIGLRPYSHKRSHFGLHYRLDEDFPDAAQQVSQAVLRQFGDPRCREGELYRNRIALCPLLEPLRSATLIDLVVFLH